MRRRAVAVTLAVVAVVAAGVYAKAATLDEQRRDLVTQVIEVTTQADEAEARAVHLAGMIALADDESAELESVLEVRPEFLAELEALSSAFAEAEGKVDVADERTAAVSTQQTVLAEREEPGVVVAATATIRALRTEVDEEVAGWERVQAASSAAPGPKWAAGGQDAYARVRAALDRVGGGGVGLYESSSCAGGSAPACANSNGYIKFRADIATWSDGRLNWAMAHELAHIHQFRVWGSLNASAAYQSLFGGDPEFLANCMALVRGYAGSVGCDGDQQAWASGIWVGAVR
ncbi:hypothetical protein [Microbacterium sp. CIAB417]|uniref:hypothetical protein n=1 Tax=Microbacterium sp. CIAB417 TaxID=2860287 RepID=UPI001FAC3D55|nr:hypothetical protein [Microbacterium sp. CIAB417]